MALMIDIQSVLQSFGRAWVFTSNVGGNPPTGDYKEIGPTVGFNAHILVIPTKEGPELAIRCGGNPHTYRKLKGTYIPLMLKNVVQPNTTNDHMCGCHKLNGTTNPDLVKSFAKLFDRTVNKLYVDTNITITFDYSRIEDTLEGLIPVKVQGCPYCVFERTFQNDTDEISGYLCMGNCV